MSFWTFCTISMILGSTITLIIWLTYINHKKVEYQVKMSVKEHEKETEQTRFHAKEKEIALVELEIKRDETRLKVLEMIKDNPDFEEKMKELDNIGEEIENNRIIYQNSMVITPCYPYTSPYTNPETNLGWMGCNPISTQSSILHNHIQTNVNTCLK